MDEHERLQELKLPDSEISRPGCLLTFFALNADAHVRLHDHIDVVGTVADG